MGIPFGMFEPASSWMSSMEMFGEGRGSMLRDRQDQVLEVLLGRRGEELRVAEVYEALERDVPENVIAVALGGLVHRGLVERRSEAQPGRRRAVSWYRAVGGP